jgi:hypothetical protein
MSCYKLHFCSRKNVNRSNDLLEYPIFNANKTKVLNYWMKNFDKLYLQFNPKNFDQNLLLQRKNFKLAL